MKTTAFLLAWREAVVVCKTSVIDVQHQGIFFSAFSQKSGRPRRKSAGL
jgi:hypothetical protein